MGAGDIQRRETGKRTHIFDISIEGKTPGRFEERVLFTTNREGRHEIVVPVRGEVVGRQKVSPRSLVLGVAPANGCKKIHLVVEFQEDHSKVDAIAVTDRDWKVLNWKQTDKQKRVALIEADVRLPSAGGYRRSTLRVTLRGNDTIDVPIGALLSRSDNPP